ncbi:radical SAM protein [Candidatus Margulisiibacteriota bacterium]
MEKMEYDIDLGGVCNNNCLFCSQGEKGVSTNERDLSLKEVKATAKKISGNCEGIIITGGEPTLRDYLPELLIYLKKLKFKKIQLQSNGRRFAYEDYCKQIVDTGVTEFSIALNSHLAEHHDQLSTVQNSFKQTLGGIRNLKKHKAFVTANAIITKINYKDLPDLANLMITEGVDKLKYSFVRGIGNAFDNKKDIVPSMKEVIPYLKKALDIGKKFNKKMWVVAVPNCLLEEHMEYLSAMHIPVKNTKKMIKDYIIERFDKTRAKPKKCEKCKYFLSCVGPWKEYVEKYGIKEFIPVK